MKCLVKGFIKDLKKFPGHMGIVIETEERDEMLKTSKVVTRTYVCLYFYKVSDFIGKIVDLDVRVNSDNVAICMNRKLEA